MARNGTTFMGDHGPVSVMQNGQQIAGSVKEPVSGTDRISWDAPYKAALPSVVVKGAGEQEKLTGKNLIDPNEVLFDGRYWRKDGPVFITEKSGATPLQAKVALITGQTVYFSAEVYKEEASVVVYLRVKNSSEKEIKTGDYDTQSGLRKLSFVAPYDDVFSFEVAQSDNIAGRVSQLYLSYTDTPYEPYCGGIAAPNPGYPIEPVFGGECELVSRGKNLFDVESWYNFIKPFDPPKVEKTADGYVRFMPSLKNYKQLYKIYGKKNTQYTFTILGHHGGEYPQQCGFDIYYADGSYSRFSAYYQNETTDKISKYVTAVGKTLIGIKISYIGNVNCYLKWMQVEEGITSTPYEPYFDGGTATVPVLRGLPDGSVMDEWDATTGKLTRRIGEYELQSSAIRKSSSSSFICANIGGILDNWKSYTGISTHYGKTSAIGKTDNTFVKTDVIYFNDYRGLLLDTQPIISWVDDQKVRGTPVTFWYELKTPIIEQYPVDTQPIVLRQHPGTTQLLAQGNKLPLHIEAKVFKEME